MTNDDRAAGEHPVWRGMTIRGIEVSQRIVSQQLMRQGRHLVAARAKLSPEAFAALLADVGIPPASADLLVRIVGLFPEAEAVDHLHPGAMLALAQPGVPDQAIAAARTRAQRGETITLANAQRIIADHAATGRRRPANLKAGEPQGEGG